MEVVPDKTPEYVTVCPEATLTDSASSTWFALSSANAAAITIMEKTETDILTQDNMFLYFMLKSLFLV